MEELFTKLKRNITETLFLVPFIPFHQWPSAANKNQWFEINEMKEKMRTSTQSLIYMTIYIQQDVNQLLSSLALKFCLIAKSF